MTVPLTRQLEAELGSANVLVDPDVVAWHETDWTGRWRGRSRCVVRPGTTADVAAVLRVCREAGVGVVVQGGNTGLVGGTTPRDGDVVLVTTRLTQLGDVDVERGLVTVGAGVTLAAAEAHAAAHGWSVGVDLASRDSATIGGMTATDAGGTRAVAHGSMRARVRGLEAVLADGTVLTPWTQGLAKDTAGLDVRSLLVGSEGVLAVLTAVQLQLVRPRTPDLTVLLGVEAPALSATVAGVEAWCHRTGATLLACELVTRRGAELVEELTGRPSPLRSDLALLVEVAGGGADREALLAGLGTGDPVLAQDAEDRRRLWETRELHTEALAALGTPVKLDVGVPVPALAALVDRLPATVAMRTPAALTVVFGHAAEGNVHVNVLGATGHEAAVEESVYELTGQLGGTISAEHGIGRAKPHLLHLTRDPGSVRAMRLVKQALDPDGLLGPGVLLPPTAGT